MPKFQCWGDGLPEDEAVEVTAHSAPDAAERFCAERDRRTLEYDPERVVFVRTAAGVRAFEVTLRSEPVYEARARKES